MVKLLKNFLSNKFTITLLGVIAGITVLVGGYIYRVNKVVNPQVVPCAKVEIPPKTIITAEMIGTCKLPKSVVQKQDNLIKLVSGNNIVGKYVSFTTNIPAGSVFYDDVLLSPDEMPDSAFADIPDEYTIYSLAVNLSSTYGNSIYPNDYIDLYLKAKDDVGKVIYGELIEAIEVLAVKDSQGNHVFESTIETKTPSELLFAVPDDMYLLLMKAGYISSNSIEIIPVPRNAAYVPENGTKIASEYLKQFILNKTVIIPDDKKTSSE